MRNQIFYQLIFFVMSLIIQLSSTYPRERRQIIYYTYPQQKNSANINNPAKIASVISRLLQQQSSTQPVALKTEDRKPAEAFSTAPKSRHIIVYYRNSANAASIQPKNFPDWISKLLRQQNTKNMMLVIPNKSSTASSSQINKESLPLSSPTTTQTPLPSPPTTVRSLPLYPSSTVKSLLLPTSEMEPEGNETLYTSSLSNISTSIAQSLNDTNTSQVKAESSDTLLVLPVNHTIIEAANTTLVEEKTTIPETLTKRPNIGKNHTSIKYTISEYSVSSSDKSESRDILSYPKIKIQGPQQQTKTLSIKVQDPGFMIFTALTSNSTDYPNPVYVPKKEETSIAEESQTSASTNVHSEEPSVTSSPKTYVLIEDFNSEKMTRKTSKKINPENQGQTETNHESRKSIVGSKKDLRHNNYYETNFTYVADETVANRRVSTLPEPRTAETGFLPISDIPFFNPFAAFNSHSSDNSESRGANYDGYSNDGPGQYFHASEARDRGYGVLGSGNFEVVRGGIFREAEGSENSLTYDRDGTESYNQDYHDDGESQFGTFSPFQFQLFNALSERRSINVPPQNRRLRFGGSQLIPTTADLVAMA